MTVAPLPSAGGVHLDPRDPSRALRVSAHADLGLITISMWRGDRCVATHQVRREDVPSLVAMLTNTLVAAANEAASAAS